MSPERQIELLKHRMEISRRYWVRAAEAALADIPGASRSDHPAHDLWLRVEMAKMPPMEIVQSAEGTEAAQVASQGPGMNPDNPITGRGLKP